MKQSLPGIKTLYTVNPKTLSPHIDRKFEAGIKYTIATQKKEVDFTGVPLATAETNTDNGSTIQTVKLTFNTDADFLDDGSPKCWIIKDVQGRTYLIGRRETPYPVMKFTKSTGAPSGDASVTSVTITFTAKTALIPCII